VSSVDHEHLLMIGAGPGNGAAIVRRFGREGFRATLVARSAEKLDQQAEELSAEGIAVETLVCDIADLDSFRSKLETVYAADGAPGVVFYNAALMAMEDILTASVEDLRRAVDVDVLGAVVAAQVAAPALREAGRGTILFTGGGLADHPVPAVAGLAIGKAGIRSVAKMVAASVADDNIHAATVTIVGEVKPGTAFDPDTIADTFWAAHAAPKDQWQAEYRFDGKS
jgi:NADP-dependent 3-hydroxy acid dehydrogenase YdfG